MKFEKKNFVVKKMLEIENFRVARMCHHTDHDHGPDVFSEYDLSET